MNQERKTFAIKICLASIIGGLAFLIYWGIASKTVPADHSTKISTSTKTDSTTAPDSISERPEEHSPIEDPSTIGELFSSAQSEEELRNLLTELLPDYETEVLDALAVLDHTKFNLYSLNKDFTEYLAEQHGPIGSISVLGNYASESYPFHWHVAQNLLALHASKASIDELEQFAADVSKHALVSSVAHDYGSQMGRLDPKRAVQSAHQLTGIPHEKMLNGALHEWFKQSPYEVAEYITTVEPHPKYDDITDSYITHIKHNEPSEAMVWALAMQNEYYREGTIVEVADVWYKKSPDQFFNWFNQLEDPKLAHAISEELSLTN